MKKLTDSELYKLKFGDVIKVVFSNTGEKYTGVIFGNKTGYTDGKVDDIHVIAEQVYDKICHVYLV